jgi:hypothetical protein
MLLFRRRHAEPPVKDLWGLQFSTRRVPLAPDPALLDQLLLRLRALVELRAVAANVDHATALVDAMELEIRNTLESPSKYRDWRETRPRVLQLLMELGQVLYQELPPPSD